jgi:hypothetical protein
VIRGQDSGIRDQDSGIRDQDSGIRGQGSGDRDQGSEREMKKFSLISYRFSTGMKRNLSFLPPDSCPLTPDPCFREDSAI